ncbi:MAG: prevent-host-death protein [Hydrogenophilales bacterium CG03_land_8_20_14_0_80_62_28]|nr:MAG: prevent-host-death protein [Hydrogenophilaceae bacterium CG1_02_62_390]PIV22598.1 MAG: prevent-host-death protein [Hydrogenophilales bacterium CG03_land_8_20_14_0_80_62_28]PIW38841.1 MAG: prevent-host-death protein [Hydrogenophilales bacterium CG15_BIG_FIL_POST_REV_8_21_14_020_62_31]PIW72640.1 MAG: prevent-host-death protein [Hydrogenophilales bacterium CG12_big_fil_rev_8_21_14_0_65_61_21]PIY98451.1 MAG: prevent-host-death protein [Hydrogenophilales bacterium CG_4_10_14_0_8_um_filter_62
MNIVPAQEIKRCGIAAVDEALAQGPVHIIKNNRPQYVVLTEQCYSELIESRDEAALARIKASLADAKAGRVTRHDSVEALMQHLDSEPAA